MSVERGVFSGVLRAASAYFAMVFAAGFVLGAARMMFIAPRTGELMAVLLELPIMLIISWFACGRALRRHPVPANAAAHAATGTLALAFLLVAELILAVAAFGGTPATFAAHLATPPGALGLAGQVAFALFPLVRAPR